MSRFRARVTTIATVLAMVAAASPSRADQPAPPPDASPRQPPPPPPPPAADPAWSQYDDAFVQLGHGEADLAHAGLLQLTTRWPTHPAATQAVLRLAELEARFQVRVARAGASARRVARGELVFWSTLGSVLVASNLCVDGCSSDRTAAAVYSLTIGAQFAGLAAGLGLWQTWRPDPGEVGLANSGLLWGALLSVYGQLLVNDDATLRSTVVLGDVGLVAGALIAHQVPMSRGRTLLIDLGGVLGSLAGGLITLSTHDDQTAGGVLLVSTAAGLVIAGLATREWDVEPPRSLKIVPAKVGTPGAGAAWGAAVVIDL